MKRILAVCTLLSLVVCGATEAREDCNKGKKTTSIPSDNDCRDGPWSNKPDEGSILGGPNSQRNRPADTFKERPDLRPKAPKDDRYLRY